MTSALLLGENDPGPILFGLDSDFQITDVSVVDAADERTPSPSLQQQPFLALIPPEARGAADDFFARLLVEQTCSTNQLFLKLPDQKAVPIDLLCRRVASGGRRIWEAIVWNRERYSRTERELMLLYAVSSRINQSTNEFAFAEEILFQIHNMMDVDASGLMHLKRGRLQLEATRGLSGESLSLLKNLPAWQVDLYLPVDSSDSPAIMPQGVMERADAICSASNCQPWLVVPVRTPIQFYGILGVTRKSGVPFSERERYLLMSLGRNLANASEKGRLFRRVKERNRNLARSRRELRKSLESLERAHRELQHLDEMKKSFVTLASHELQTPLTTIIGNAELLRRGKAEMPARLRESLTEMLGGVDDLRARVETLLAANRVGSGFFAPRFNRYTTQQIFADLEPEFQALANGRTLQLQRCAQGQCPDILLDVELVKQALRLEFENALRHTQTGGEISLRCQEFSRSQMLGRVEDLRLFYPDIEERLDRFVDYAHIMVEDNGEGVAKEEQVKIFAPFYAGGLERHHSSRTSNDSGKGFGLGLSLAKRIIEAHNGLIWYEARAGGGSRFCQLLPLPL